MIRKQSPATVSTICFRIHYGCIIYKLFFTIPLVAHYPKLLACRGSLKRKVTIQKGRSIVMEIYYRHCASAFLCLILWENVLR